MRSYYFTFGVGQLLRHYYVVICAESETEARLEMVQQFGQAWSSCYDETVWADKVDIYFADLLPIGPLAPVGTVL